MVFGDNPPLSPTDYPINLKRLPNSAQDRRLGLFKLNLYPTEEHDLLSPTCARKVSRLDAVLLPAATRPHRASGPSTVTATSWA